MNSISRCRRARRDQSAPPPPRGPQIRKLAACAQDDLMCWSGTFSCAGTFRNYCGHVQTACEVLRLDTSAFGNRRLLRCRSPAAPPARGRASRAQEGGGSHCAARRTHAARTALRSGRYDCAITWPTWSQRGGKGAAAARHSPANIAVAQVASTMFLITYIFLLRLPSECIPIRWCGNTLSRGRTAGRTAC